MSHWYINVLNFISLCTVFHVMIGIFKAGGNNSCLLTVVILFG